MATRAAGGKPAEAAVAMPASRTWCVPDQAAAAAPGSPRPRPSPELPHRPGWLPTLAAVALVPLCLKLGFWQWDKAERLSARHAQLAAAAAAAPQPLPAGSIDEPAGWAYRQVVARGEYLAAGQILIDNQVRDGRVGVSVITPLRLAGGDRVVLVDRGWLPTADDPRAPLAPSVPRGAQTIQGIAWPADARHFALAPDTAPAGGNARWQHLDLARYAQAAGVTLQPLIVRLSPDSDGGFARIWPAPLEREPKHRSYALQWFAFAATIAALWAGFTLRALLARQRGGEPPRPGSRA